MSVLLAILGLTGGGAYTYGPTAYPHHEHLIFWSSLGAMAFSLCGLLFLFGQTKDDEPMAGDTYNVNNSGSGFAAGQVGTVNIGKVPFQLTDKHKQHVLASVDRTRPVSVGYIGYDGGLEIATELRRFLEANGIKTVDGITAGMMNPPLSEPLQIRGNTIMVDPSR